MGQGHRFSGRECATILFGTAMPTLTTISSPSRTARERGGDQLWHLSNHALRWGARPRWQRRGGIWTCSLWTGGTSSSSSIKGPRQLGVACVPRGLRRTRKVVAYDVVLWQQEDVADVNVVGGHVAAEERLLTLVRLRSKAGFLTQRPAHAQPAPCMQVAQQHLLKRDRQQSETRAGRPGCRHTCSVVCPVMKAKANSPSLRGCRMMTHSRKLLVASLSGDTAADTCGSGVQQRAPLTLRRAGSRQTRTPGRRQQPCWPQRLLLAGWRQAEGVKMAQQNTASVGSQRGSTCAGRHQARGRGVNSVGNRAAAWRRLDGWRRPVRCCHAGLGPPAWPLSRCAAPAARV